MPKEVPERGVYRKHGLDYDVHGNLLSVRNAAFKLLLTDSAYDIDNEDDYKKAMKVIVAERNDGDETGREQYRAEYQAKKKERATGSALKPLIYHY